ncbi:MAG: hypothetical protein M1827_007459 [Pycnora praestabilis]|nr:MAG: hypothetical protein M1827_007459 [Pycnora praestabilis]
MSHRGAARSHSIRLNHASDTSSTSSPANGAARSNGAATCPPPTLIRGTSSTGEREQLKGKAGRRLIVGEHGNDEGRTSYTPGSNARARRTACDVCRERKVRCDGDRPICQRCMRLGHSCGYTVTKRQDASRYEVCQALETLHERLAQAEARLPLTQPVAEPPMETLPWLACDPSADCNDLLHMCDAAGTGTFTKPSYIPFWNFGLDHTSMQQASTEDQMNDVLIDEGHEMLDPALSLDASPGSFDKQGSDILGSLIPIDYYDVEETLSPEVFNNLHNRYFDGVHPYLPMINRDTFGIMSVSPQQTDLSSLSYAMAMLGASSTEEYTLLEKHCYRRSRADLEMIERQEDGGRLINLQVLQACLLIALYEIKRQNFARAWMSIGRAIRLTLMLGLHKMDLNGPSLSSPGFQPGLPATQDWTEIEERRRTFWVAFNLDWYASIRSGSSMTIEESEITTRLPSMSFQPHEFQSAPMMSLQEAMRKSEQGPRPLSSFTGVTVMAALCCRCLKHVRVLQDKLAMEQDQSYAFWTEHYRLDKTLLAHSEYLLDHFKLTGGVTDPNNLSLNVMVHTTTIVLHEAAVTHAEESPVSDAVKFESQRRCETAAMDIACIMELVDRSHFPKMSTLMTWCLYTASRVFLRMMKAAQAPFDGTTLNSLQSLVSAMMEFEKASPYTECLINQVHLELESLGVLM